MSRAQGFANGMLDAIDEAVVKFELRTHFHEEQDTFVFVLGATLSDANCVVDLVAELVEDGIDLRGAEANTTGIQHSIAATAPGQDSQDRYLRKRMRTFGQGS